MTELVPIKIKVTKDGKGHFVYPKFKNKLQFFREHRDYQSEPLIYDKKYDCKTEGAGSPIGMRWCMKLVPKEFAIEALQVFSSTVFEMTEDEAEDFYDNRAKISVSENNYDIKTLQGLQLELVLKEKLKQDTSEVKERIRKAIDPNDDSSGVRKNKEKKWKDLKASMNLKVVKAVVS